MKLRTDGHTISGAFVFLLLGLFAVLSTMLILFGAQAYRGTVERTADHADARVAASYIRNMVRAADQAGCVTVEEHDGLQVIALNDGDFEGDSYTTYIYAANGSLCELFTMTADGFRAESGETITDAQSLEAAVSDGLLTATITAADGTGTTVRVALRSGTGGGADEE